MPASRTYATMAEQATISTQDLLAKIEAGTEAIRTSDDFAELLRIAAKFHNYSFGNVMLISLQMPGATRVAGFHTWLKLGRSVRKGEHGIRILAPCVGKARASDDEQPDDAPEGTQTAPRRMFFKAVPVFDISQTDGEDFPEIARKLDGDDEIGLLRDMWCAAGAAELTIDVEPTHGHGDANGYYVASERRIWLNGELSGVQTCKTIAHELAHHFAGHGDKDCHDSRGERECVAESAAYMVMQAYGIDSGQYTFGYLASWCEDTKVIKAKAAEIFTVARAILSLLSEV